MHYQIRDLLEFVRTHDATGLFSKKSNTQMRKHIRACLHKNRFWFVYHNHKLVGLVEWYRIKDCQYLVRQVREEKHLNCNPSGKIIYVSNAVFDKNYLTTKVFRAFVRQHKNITSIIWFRYKTKKFKSVKV